MKKELKKVVLSMCHTCKCCPDLIQRADGKFELTEPMTKEHLKTLVEKIKAGELDHLL